MEQIDIYKEAERLEHEAENPPAVIEPEVIQQIEVSPDLAEYIDRKIAERLAELFGNSVDPQWAVAVERMVHPGKPRERLVLSDYQTAITRLYSHFGTAPFKPRENFRVVRCKGVGKLAIAAFMQQAEREGIGKYTDDNRAIFQFNEGLKPIKTEEQ